MPQIQATIDRFEGDKAVLIFADGQQLIIDKKDLAQEIKEGDIVYLKISPEATETDAKQAQAKDLLQEILKKQNEET